MLQDILSARRCVAEANQGNTHQRLLTVADLSRRSPSGFILRSSVPRFCLSQVIRRGETPNKRKVLQPNSVDWQARVIRRRIPAHDNQGLHFPTFRLLFCCFFLHCRRQIKQLFLQTFVTAFNKDAINEDLRN